MSLCFVFSYVVGKVPILVTAWRHRVNAILIADVIWPPRLVVTWKWHHCHHTCHTCCITTRLSSCVIFRNFTFAWRFSSSKLNPMNFAIYRHLTSTFTSNLRHLFVSLLSEPIVVLHCILKHIFWNKYIPNFTPFSLPVWLLRFHITEEKKSYNNIFFFLSNTFYEKRKYPYSRVYT